MASITSEWAVFRKGSLQVFYNKKNQSTSLIPPSDYTPWLNTEIGKHLKLSGSNWRSATTTDGKIYFYNKITKETQWDCPKEVENYISTIETYTRNDDTSWSIPSDLNEWMIQEINRYLLTLNSNEWICKKGNEGQRYYYNTITNKETTTTPKEIKEFESFLPLLYIELSEKSSYSHDISSSSSSSSSSIDANVTIPPMTSNIHILKRDHTKSDDVIDIHVDHDRKRISSSSSNNNKKRIDSNDVHNEYYTNPTTTTYPTLYNNTNPLDAYTENDDNNNNNTNDRYDKKDEVEGDYDDDDFKLWAEYENMNNKRKRDEDEDDDDEDKENEEDQKQEQEEYVEGDHTPPQASHGMFTLISTPELQSNNDNHNTLDEYTNDVNFLNEYTESESQEYNYSYENTEGSYDKNDDYIYTSDDHEDNKDLVGGINISDPSGDMTDTKQESDTKEELEIQNASNELNMIDSIMNIHIIQHIQTILQYKKESLGESVKNIIDNYIGYAQITTVLINIMKRVKATNYQTSTTTGTNNNTTNTTTTISNPNNGNHLTEAISITTTSSSGKNTTSEAQTIPVSKAEEEDEYEREICQCLADYTKYKYNKDLADHLIYKLSGIPMWLTAMINHPIFRKMLIELYDHNKGSSLLGICLREISSKGYHREISKVIREVDYFDVFNNMILDVVTSILSCTQETELYPLVEDMKRMSCHTEYMFIYAYELLSQLENYLRVTSDTTQQQQQQQQQRSHTTTTVTTTNTTNSNDKSSQPQQRVYRKTYKRYYNVIRRLRQELLQVVSWTKREGGSHGRLTSSGILAFKMSYEHLYFHSINHNNNGNSTTHSHNNRQEKAGVNIYQEIKDIIISDYMSDTHIIKLYQGYFHHHSSTTTNATTTTTASAAITKNTNIIATSSDISHTPKSHTILLHQIQYMISANKPIQLLQDTQIFNLLITEYVKKPLPSSSSSSSSIAHTSNSDGSRGSRVNELPDVHTCLVRLIAMASVLDITNQDEGYIENICQEIHLLESQLLTAKQIWTELYKLSYGILSYEKAQPLKDLIRIPVISLCIQRWIYTCIHNEQYITKNSFLVILPIVLQLIVWISSYHSLQRPECFELLKVILSMSTISGGGYHSESRQSASDTYTIMSAQQEAIEVLIYMMGVGYTLGPLEYLVQKADEFDAVTLRRIVYLLLESIHGPFSLLFLTPLISFLDTPSVQRAVISSHFQGKNSLSLFIQQLQQQYHTYATSPNTSTTVKSHDDNSGSSSSSKSNIGMKECKKVNNKEKVYKSIEICTRLLDSLNNIRTLGI